MRILQSMYFFVFLIMYHSVHLRKKSLTLEPKVHESATLTTIQTMEYYPNYGHMDNYHLCDITTVMQEKGKHCNIQAKS